MSVEVELTLRYVRGDDGRGPMPASLRYDPDEPWTAVLVLDPLGAAVEWLFGRDLLAAGMHGHAGHGDVEVWPHPTAPLLYIALSAIERDVCFLAQRNTVARFLRESFRLVPKGRETLPDLDDELAALVKEETP